MKLQLKTTTEIKMLVKELEKYLLSECANCSCHINPFDKANTTELCDRNKIFGNAKSNLEALSYIYEIPSDKLTVNITSHYAISEDSQSDENDPLALPMNINLTLCKICSPVFGEVYRAHTKLKQIATDNNFISKSIHYNNLPTKLNNANVKNLAEQEITLEEFKVEIEEDNEETENKTENKFTLPDIKEVEEQGTIQPSESEINEAQNKDTIECNQPEIDEDEKEDTMEYSEPEIDEDEINYQLSEEANSDNDPIGTGASDSSDSGDELEEDDITDVKSEEEMSITSVPDYTFDFDSMEQESAVDSPSNIDVKPKKSRRKQILGRLNNEVDECLTYNSLIKGPPYNCPSSTCNLIYKNRTDLTTHCKLNHKLLIHPTCFANVESLNERNTPREGFATTNMKIRLGDEKSNIELSIHDSVIKGPPFNCPKCVQWYSSNSSLSTHCKDDHRLLLPTLTKGFSCSECKCSFNTIGSLRFHCRNQHKTDFFCSLCHSCFTTNDKLLLHLKTSCKLICKTDMSLSASSVGQAKSEESCGLESNENCDAQQTQIHPNVNNFTTKEGIKLKSSAKFSPRSTSKSVKDGLSSNEVGKVIIYTLDEAASPPFKCLKCDESFDSEVLLIKHSLKVHKVILSIKKTLKRGITRRRNYFCDECNESVLATMEEIKTHLRTFHFEKFVSCERKTKVTDLPTTSRNESLACRECGLEFGNFDSLKSHNLEIHSVTLEDAKSYFFPFICRRCDKHYEIAGRLTQHLQRVHKTLKPMDCKFCTETFYSVELLTAHMRLVHNIKLTTYNQKVSALKCTVCSKIFQSQTDLNFHKILRSEKSNDIIPLPTSNESSKSDDIPSASVNENIAKLTCQVCNVQFETEDELRQHQTENHAEHIENSSTGPFVCHLCDKKFSLKFTLYTHMRIVHLKMKKNNKTCKICGEQIPQSVSMPEHVKTAHIQERLFKCQICNKDFKSLYALKQHKATHSKVLSFTCITCGKRFKNSSSIRRHERMCLNSGTKFGCDKCTASFKTEISLQRHIEDHNYKEIGAQLKCEKCDEVFPCPSKLKYHTTHSHAKAGPVPCPICEKVFTARNRLNLHMRTVHRDKK